MTDTGKDKQLSRRDLFTKFGKGLAAAAGAKFLEPLTILAPVTEQTASPEQMSLGGVSFNFGADGFPVSYSVSDQTYQISKDMRDSMLQKAKEAKNKQEPELLLSVTGDNIYQDAPSWTEGERPLVDHLPEDALNEDQLKERGVIQIIQGKYVTLHLRDIAFQQGGVLHNLPRAQSIENPVKLRIVLVDAAFANGTYMESDSKYDDVSYLAGYVPTDLEGFRNQQINALESQISGSQADYQIIDLKARIDDYQTATWEELTQKMVSMKTEAAGLYVEPTKIDDDGDRVATIFIAVGQSLPIQERVKLFVDQKGRMRITSTLGINPYYYNYRPDWSTSFPKPEDFQYYPENGYPFGAQNYEAGEILTHEIMHLNMITLEPILDGKIPNYSEHDTDLAAMNQIASASHEWLDNHKNIYPFIFHEGNIYQVTKYIKPKNNQEEQV